MISTSTVVLNLLPYWSVTVIGNVLIPNVVSVVAEMVTACSSGSIGIALLPPREETSILALATSNVLASELSCSTLNLTTLFSL